MVGSDVKRMAKVEIAKYHFEVEIMKDSAGHKLLFGQGAWSTVYRAIGHPTPFPGSGEPPSSFPPPPVTPTPLLVAVKAPARSDAAPILMSEARVLSHLMGCVRSDEFVIPFYGLIFATTSLVLRAVPLSLHDHVKICAYRARCTDAVKCSHAPVIGSTKTWLSLAHQIVGALAWLHDEAGVVHGDIKPGNILLSPSHDEASVFPFLPLLADFSSSQILSSAEITPNTLSAMTPEYTAPELLLSTILKDPKSVATTASDVFSLAVTLLVCATGELMVYSGSRWQRQAMATQGWLVLDHVRNGDLGTRVSPGGVVDQVLEKAVLRSTLRISARRWLLVIEEQLRADPGKEKL